MVDGLEALGCTVHIDPSLDGTTLGACLADQGAQVLIVRSTKVPAEAIEAGGGSLRVIIRAGSGYDNIDCAAAAGRGVAVCNTPGMNAVAVAELAMGHLIAIDRRLPEQNTALKGGRWNKKEYSNAVGLKGRSLLVIGAGAIGQEMIKRASAFGMKISVYAPQMPDDQARSLGVDRIGFSREELLAALPRFDAVSMHVPAVDSTRGMCDGAFFGAMKHGAIFINTSRGAIVDESALIAAARSGKVRAGLDVYQDQPSEKDTAWSPEIACVEGVYCSHHCGASTDQAQIAVSEEVVRMVGQFQADGAILHCVNNAAGIDPKAPALVPRAE
jgi:D-3-phosphoglycerate dehydrogenase